MSRMNAMPLPASRPSLGHRLLFMAVAALVALLGQALFARANEPLMVQVDRAKVMRISRPANTVIVGNPAIADATIQDRQTLIITGRSFGTTNLIVLDGAGQPIADELVTVSAADDRLVTIYRRATRETYSCTPNCQPVIRVGDNTAAFNTTEDQLKKRNGLINNLGTGAQASPAN